MTILVWILPLVGFAVIGYNGQTIHLLTESERMALDPHADLELQDSLEGVASPAGAQPSVDRSGVQLHLRAADILERVADAFIALDREWRIVYANREACRINQKSSAEFVGKIHWEEWPAAVGTELERQFRHAMDAQVDVHFEHRYTTGPYDVWLEIEAYPSEDGLNLFYRDITARKTRRRRTEAERGAVPQPDRRDGGDYLDEHARGRDAGTTARLGRLHGPDRD